MPLIELDLLIALVNTRDKLHDIAIKIFEKIHRGELKGYAIPASALLEYELVLRSRGYPEDKICEDIEAFTQIRNIKEIPLTSKILIEASKIRRLYSLTYFDSLHAASALAYDETIISSDKAYRKIPTLRALDPHQIL